MNNDSTTGGDQSSDSLAQRFLTRLVPQEEWRRNQYALTLGVFVSFLGFTFVVPFLPLYVTQLGITDVHVAAFWSGLLFAVSPLLSAIMNPVWGILADRFGTKPMLERALLSFVVIMILTGMVSNVYQLLALRAALGLSGGFGALSMALVVSIAPADRVGEAIGLMQTAQLLDKAVGPVLGGGVADLIGIRYSFFITALLCLLALVIIHAAFRESRKGERVGRGESRIPLLRALLLPNFLSVCLTVFLIQFVDRSFTPIIPLYLSMLNAPPTVIATIAGAVISSGAVASAVSATVFGRLTRRYDPRRLLLISLGGGILLCLPFAFVNSWWQLLILQPALGIFTGAGLTLSYTIGGQTIPATHRATAFGLLASAASLGVALGPFAMGSLAAFNMRAVFVAGSIVYLANLIWVVAKLRAKDSVLPPNKSGDTDG